LAFSLIGFLIGDAEETFWVAVASTSLFGAALIWCWIKVGREIVPAQFLLVAAFNSKKAHVLSSLDVRPDRAREVDKNGSQKVTGLRAFALNSCKTNSMHAVIVSTRR
jgi:hypothetical protein